jgi:NAD(P)-dependent dehydrogenase (short-subunit alcohol dehydrogenase family)
MAISEFAKKYHEKMFPDHVSAFSETDPEFIERFDNFADEVANVAELLMSNKGAFITGATFLIDGGATSSYFYGPLKPAE